MGTLANTIAALRQAQLPSPALPPPAVAPLGGGSLPNVPQAALPNVVGPPPPPPSQLQMDTAKRNDLINSGSGISRIQNPVLRGLATAGDDGLRILGSVFQPVNAIEHLIPGTQGNLEMHMQHQNLLIDREQQQRAADTAQQDAEAQTAERTAKAQQDIAKANQADDPRKAYDPSKTVQTDDGVYQLNPDSGKYDIRVGDRVDKPKPIEEQAYEYAMSKGASPLDAYAQVHGAGNTKDAGLPQQYLDAIASGDTAKAGLIKRVIQDTQVAPKIQVMQAAGQERVQERASALSTKNSDVDVSSPDAVASLTAVAHGAAPITTLLPRGATVQQRQKVLSSLLAINPNFNSGLASSIAGTENDAAHGAMAKNMTAIRTANDHLGQLGAAASALKNGNVQALSKIGNAYNVQMGSSAATNFDAVRSAVAGELAKALTGTATVDEIHQMTTGIHNAQSPDQLQGVVKTYQALMKSKAGEQQKQYEQGKSGKYDFSLGNTGDGGPPPSGMSVSLKDAMALAQNKGKSADEVRADIKSHGHGVRE